MKFYVQQKAMDSKLNGAIMDKKWSFCHFTALEIKMWIYRSRAASLVTISCDYSITVVLLPRYASSVKCDKEVDMYKHMAWSRFPLLLPIIVSTIQAATMFMTLVG